MIDWSDVSLGSKEDLARVLINSEIRSSLSRLTPLAVFETVHISPRVIDAVLTEQPLNPFVECPSGFVGGKRLSVAFKLGLQ